LLGYICELLRTVPDPLANGGGVKEKQAGQALLAVLQPASIEMSMHDIITVGIGKHVFGNMQSFTFYGLGSACLWKHAVADTVTMHANFTEYLAVAFEASTLSIGRAVCPPSAGL